MTRKNIDVFRDAVTFANSGKYASWKEIETALVNEGHRRAPHLLDSTKIQTILDMQCRISRASA